MATQRLTMFSSISPVLILTFMKHDNNCRESKCVIDLFHFLKHDLKCELFLDGLSQALAVWTLLNDREEVEVPLTS